MNSGAIIGLMTHIKNKMFKSPKASKQTPQPAKVFPEEHWHPGLPNIYGNEKKAEYDRRLKNNESAKRSRIIKEWNAKKAEATKTTITQGAVK